jgi:hypothetical protein
MAESRVEPFFKRSEGAPDAQGHFRGRFLGALVKTRTFGMTQGGFRFKLTHYRRWGSVDLWSADQS